MAEQRKMRVHELAKRRKRPVNEVIEKLKEKGHDVTNSLQVLRNEEIDTAIDSLEDVDLQTNEKQDDNQEKRKEPWGDNLALGLHKDSQGNWHVLTYEINPETLETTLLDDKNKGTMKSRAILKFDETAWRRGLKTDKRRRSK